MRRLYRLALDVGVTVTLATAFAAGWIAVTGTYRPPIWVNVVAATAVVGLAWLLEEAVTAWIRPRRRAHARPAPSKTRESA
ncbi:hypothetical protein [Streptomyces collinus]|uniref:hypothetical protein n=1 Tax=Streptomyces collinus TaxID=42684 RepID=UPI00380B295B